MRFRIFTTLILFLSTFLAFSQKTSILNKIEVGGMIGASNYQGDLTKSSLQLVFPATGWHVGGLARYNVTDKFALRGNIIYGMIKGADSYSSDNIFKERNWSFTSNILEISGMVEYFILGKPRFNSSGIGIRYLTPYLFTGIGFTNAPAKLKYPARDNARFPESGDKDSFISVPIGIGVKWSIADNVNLGIEMGYRNTFSDYLDNVSINGKSGNSDWYVFGGVTMSTYLSSTSASF
jgi:OmpA-OmpF porin, OOP family